MRLLFGALALMLAAAAVQAQPLARIEIGETGIYRIHYEDLRAAGIVEAPLPAAALALSQRGRPVPIALHLAQADVFGPGAHFEFVGERLAGPGRHFHAWQQHNVYWLSLDANGQQRMVELPRRWWGSRVVARARMHAEHDELMIRVRDRDVAPGEDPELWYWAKLTHVDAAPKVVVFDLPGLDPAAEGRRLMLRLRAISEPDPGTLGGIHAHQLDLELNGVALPSAEWNGSRPHDHFVDLPAHLPLQASGNRLALRVPARIPQGRAQPIIDVVMLDFVRVDFPARTGSELWLSAPGQVELTTAHERLRLYHRDGRIAEGRVEAGRARLRLDDMGPWLLREGDGYRTPLRIVALADMPDLRAARQVDYLIIAHARLKEAVAPLAEFHRRRGLSVELIDVAWIYDQFSHGIVEPQAIRDFVAYAWRHRPRPAPRYLLLVGDASWDTRSGDGRQSRYADWVSMPGALFWPGGEFANHELEGYTQATDLPHRNLVPTWQVLTHEGHAASDNYFVAVAEDGVSPQLAVGRFPVVEAAEVEAIVAKTLGHAKAAPADWQRRLLWITDHTPFYQDTSRLLSEAAEQRGFETVKVFPQADERDNADHQQRLLEAFEQGMLLVHFIGHGGRHIWRTGPSDPLRNHDLFTLQHVKQLGNRERLPLVLSMTCYSAPFDHPSVDSIGELLLRHPDGGAVAVFAASWRNSPTRAFSMDLVETLLAGRYSVGEAIRQVKLRQSQPALIQTYNLLGDPALRLPRPTPARGPQVADHGPERISRH